jgi:hypothetical protein
MVEGLAKIAPRRSISEAIEILKNSENGEHILVLYSDLNVLRDLYSKITTQELYKMDQVVMLLPFYEGARDVKIYLEERGLNVDKAQKECSLVVADALTWFFHPGLNVKSFLGMLTEDSLQVGKKGITLIADIDCFFMNEKVVYIVEY